MSIEETKSNIILSDEENNILIEFPQSPDECEFIKIMIGEKKTTINAVEMTSPEKVMEIFVNAMKEIELETSLFDSTYGNEFVLGFSDVALVIAEFGDYVRVVCIEDNSEILYSVASEFSEDPLLTLGAIAGALNVSF